MKTVIKENQRGFLFRNGRYVKLLGAGKYHVFQALGDRTIEVVDMEHAVASKNCSLERLLEDKELEKQCASVEVADEELALHYVDGMFAGVLRTGKYAFWNVLRQHTFVKVSTKDPEVPAEIPAYIFDRIPAFLYTKVEVAEYQKGRLFYNRRFVKLLDAGTYYFWNGATRVEVNLADTRLLQMDIAGQELLTKDKVTLRINFVCTYRITDYVKILTEIDDYEKQVRVLAQLALREYVGQYRMDELLEEKEKIAEYIYKRLSEKARELYLEITDTGIRDIILPGEIRDIMNTVLVAEKRAQANVITRREEVASTRSLLNTAKLMEENQTLYKLKELEYLERICENVGTITVNGNQDLLAQLGTVLGGRQQD